MNLDNPTVAQASFVSVIMGVMTGIFGIWMGQESKGRS
jgi:Ca2+/H+ antiporter